MLIRKEFIDQVKEIILHAREYAVRAVDFQRVLMYWQVGKTIFEEEQHGQERAGYGEFLIKNLADELEPVFGSGFSLRQLELFRQFYRTFPITNALRSQLNRTQHKNNVVVKITLPEDNKTIMASQYKLYPPSEEVLRRQLEKELGRRDFGNE